MTKISPATPITAPLSEDRERELLKDAKSYVYQSEDGLELVAHCFFPPNHDSGSAKPAIVFFHGGMWDVSMPTQFAPHCMHLASRGMVAVAVEYRVGSKHNASPEDALEDAQMAMLWLRHNHATLGTDPNRIIAAGAASGAHMALSLGMLPEVLEIDGFTARPLAMIALSSIVNTGKKSPEHGRFADSKKAHKSSPLNMVRRGLPPSLIVHGKADTIVPHTDAAKFAKLMKRKKNPCEFIDFDAANHSFFNFNVSAKHFEITLNSIDAFLVGLDCLEPVEYV
ncbi:MAG: alpha/beta hydrolase [Akkermansiaceae bacterium]